MRIGIKNPFSFLFATARREQYLGQYVLREVRRGRPLGEVVADPYVVNRSTESERGRLLERPEIVEAAGEQAIAELRRGIPRP
jgi:hypothetical protein